MSKPTPAAPDRTPFTPLRWQRDATGRAWLLYCTGCGTHLTTCVDLVDGFAAAKANAHARPCCDTWSTTKTTNPENPTSVTRPASSPSSRWSPSAPSPGDSPSGSSSTGSKAVSDPHTGRDYVVVDDPVSERLEHGD